MNVKSRKIERRRGQRRLVRDTRRKHERDEKMAGEVFEAIRLVI